MNMKFDPSALDKRILDHCDKNKISGMNNNIKTLVNSLRALP